jgi:hypothetical protein
MNCCALMKAGAEAIVVSIMWLAKQLASSPTDRPDDQPREQPAIISKSVCILMKKE